MGKAIDTVQFINPEGLYDPSSNAYTHIAVVPAGQTLVFVSGQGGETADGSLAPDFRTQLRQAFANLGIALAAQGLTLQDVIKQTTLVVDHSKERLTILTEESLKVWPERKCPVNTLIPVPRLALDGMLIEIEVLAVK
jgi:enamine deaminase RidA (YjgF/YER057c/UK114 family)